MKKLKIIAMSLCMVLLCSFSLTFVGCGNENSSTNSESETSEADAYAYELLSKYNYDVDYTYTSGSITYSHTYADSVEYIRYYNGTSTIEDLESGATTTIEEYLTVAFDYTGNHPIQYTYNEYYKTYTAETYSGISVKSYRTEKLNMLTADGALIWFLYYFEWTVGEDSDLITNLTSTKTTKNGVTTLSKTCNATIEGEETTCEISLTINNGRVTEFNAYVFDNDGSLIDQQVVTYTYKDVTISIPNISDYTLVSD